LIQDISQKISWLQENPLILKGICRGIERETLRVEKNGHFSKNMHPYLIGSSLTHQWITTDFAENLLEFITPTSTNIDKLMFFLKDLHSFVASSIKNERMWPFSIPYIGNKKTNIKIAQYGNSNLGKMKTTYRIGLKKRYGSFINTIAGVHYNFSLPIKFWKEWNKQQNNKYYNDYISNGYLHLIRNYYRFGWIITYLFGSSPAISSNFIKPKNKKYIFKKYNENVLYLPWATSLRLSDIGYTKTAIEDLNITFNNLNSYTSSLKKALHTSSDKFARLKLKDKKGNFQQLNTNILQMENELYTQIRPKRRLYPGESLINALANRGVEYVEVRSLDTNPFSPIGINKNQILLLDLFLIWCTLIESPEMKKKDFLLASKNWEKIVLEGRKPYQTIYINTKNEKITLIEMGKTIFKDLKMIAKVIDFNDKNTPYYKACQKFMKYLYDPDLTYSSKLLRLILRKGIKFSGLELANQHYKALISRHCSDENLALLKKETKRSHDKQKKIEKEDSLSFREYIKKIILPC